MKNEGVFGGERGLSRLNLEQASERRIGLAGDESEASETRRTTETLWHWQWQRL